MSENSATLMTKCMNAVRREVGDADAERFVYLMLNEGFDYTKWQREHYDAMPPDELKGAIIENGKAHPFGKK